MMGTYEVTMWIELVLLSLAVATASMTLGVSRIAKPWRDWMMTYRSPWPGHFAHCPYCLSHWLAFLAVLLYHPSWWLPIEVLAVVAIASVGSWMILKFLNELEADG